MIPRFKKSRYEPKPIETDYWIDLNENEYGGVFKYYDNNAMVWKLTESITKEKEPQFTNSPAFTITTNDIDYWNNKVGIEDFDALKEEIIDLGSKYEGVTVETLEYYMDILRSEIDVKADKATTLKGYGIQDAYTKKEVDTKFDEWKVDLPENVSYFTNDAGYVTESNLEEKLPDNIVSDASYVHTDNNYTTEEKNKLAELNNYDDAEVRNLIQKNIDNINSLSEHVEEEITATVESMSKELAKKANLDEVYTKTYLDDIFTQFIRKTHKSYGFIDDRPTNELIVEDTGFVFYDYTVNEPLLWVSNEWRLLRTNEAFSGYLLKDDIVEAAGNWDYDKLSDDFLRLTKYTGDYTSTMDLTVPNVYNSTFVLELGNASDKRLVARSSQLYTTVNTTITPTDGRPSIKIKLSFITSKNSVHKTYDKSENVDKYNDMLMLDIFGNKVAEGYSGTSLKPQSPYTNYSIVTTISSLTLPLGVRHINDGAFLNVLSLSNTDLIIPSGVETIGISSFENAGITSVTFPSNPMTLGVNAFRKNPLTSVTIPKTLDWDDIKNGGASSVFADSTNSNGINLVLEEGVKAIPNYAFYNTKINSIKFPKSLEFIGGGAFYNSNISGDFDSANIKQIGPWAFRGANFSSVVFQEDVTFLSPMAFQPLSENNTCTKMVLSPNIKECHFYGFPSLLRKCAINIVTPPNLPTLRHYAFYKYAHGVNNAESLTPIIDVELTLSEGLEYMGCHALTYANFTNDLVLPESLKYISSSTFTKMCKQKIEKLRIGKNLKVIGGTYSKDGPGAEIIYYAYENGLLDKFVPISKNGYSLAYNRYEYLEDGGEVPAYSFEPFYQLATQTFKEFEVDPENKWFKSVDGVLFSKDGKRLIYYPSAKGLTTYEIPEGCVYCDGGAFYASGADADMYSVEYPYVTDYSSTYVAYGGEGKLKEIIIPDTFINYSPTEMREMFGPATINMTGNMIENMCNYVSTISKITAKDSHPLYKNDGNWLLSKDGTTLQCVLIGMHGEMRIPDSVTTIADGAIGPPNAPWSDSDYSKLSPANYRKWGVMFTNLTIIVPPSVVNMNDATLFALNILSNNTRNKTSVILEEGNPAFTQDSLTGLISRIS